MNWDNSSISDSPSPIRADSGMHPIAGPMSHEAPRDRSQVTLRLMELHWQRDIIQQWLHASPIPSDARVSLEEMLLWVDRKLADLEEQARKADN